MGFLDGFRRRKKKQQDKPKSPDRSTLMKVIDAFINAGTWAESKHVIEAHPELLTGEAEALLARSIGSEKDDRLVHILEEHRRLLARCRAQGIDAAFSDLVSSGLVGSNRLQAELAKVPPKALQIVHELEQLGATPHQEMQRLQLFERVLVFVDKQQSPLLWAALQNDFGTTLYQTPTSDWADNLERALAAFKAVLEVFTWIDFSVEWAATQNNLGLVYTERIRGNHADNLEQAITAFDAALKVYKRGHLPREWAMTQINLGNALVKRIRGNREESLERAIAAYTDALEVVTRSDFPEEWARTMHNLGNAYTKRIRDDPTENMEHAINAYTAALEIRTRDDFPVKWAMTQHSLGNALRINPNGDPAENLEQAIGAFNSALEIYTRTDFPMQWAQVQNDLGVALQERIQGDQADNLEQAVIAFNSALEVHTRSDFPYYWAMTQMNLGNALSDRIQGNRAENLERAITAFNSALEVVAQTDFPMLWAMIQNNLGNALKDRMRGDRTQNLAQAIAAYRAVIESSEALSPPDCYGASYNLGMLYYGEKQWLPAYDAFKTAISILETGRTGYLTEEAKTLMAAWSSLPYGFMVDTCLHLGRVKEALEQAEASRGRLFLDQLDTTDALSTPSLPAAQQLLLKKETRLINESRDLKKVIRYTYDDFRRRQYLARLSEKQAVLHNVWEELASHAPDYVAMRRGIPIRFDDIQAHVDDLGIATALVEFYTLPDKVVMFVVRSGENEPTVAQVPMPQAKLQLCVDTFRREVIEYRQHDDIGQRWQELAKPLLADVLPYLQGAELVYLVPHGVLHYLPLHILQVNNDCLIDNFPIAYAPSVAVLGRVIRRGTKVERTGRLEALVVGNPTKNLLGAEDEARRIAQIFDAQPYLREKATKFAVQAKLPNMHVVHLACHGHFDSLLPMQSGVVLAGEECLSAREIMALDLQADLVTLSACETGRSKIGVGDEIVGLTRAFLYAGASSVLVSLWIVDDESTEQLMVDFYNRLYDSNGRNIKAGAIALREATQKMRDKKEHPYHWASFVLVGDWRSQRTAAANCAPNC